ncbi:DUF6221 family protein [Streptomyces sp. DW26H14]|uniref:DUF6221 family protein n=1 Tax=Streptomyces sp. DW26H14 TaxID=3435395 RepID=UPI00403D9D09
MDDLLAFLRARLDEDEATARAASDGPWTTWTGPIRTWMTKGNLCHTVMTWDHPTGHAPIMTESWMDSRHIAEWHPARVLAEVEAKRRILECHEPWTASNGDIICGRCGREHIDGRPGGHFPCQTLRLLTLPDASHPDYREEWRP